MMLTLNTANPDVLTPEMALQEAIPVLSRLVDDHDFPGMLPLVERTPTIPIRYRSSSGLRVQRP